MKTRLFAVVFLLASWALPLHAARFYRSPEVPNVTCADGIDNDADGTVDAADTDCVAAATFVADGGNGYQANFKDAIVTGYTTAADATAGSGTYLKKASTTAGFYVGEGALHANFTNATYYAWIRYRCSETRCPIWLSTTPILGTPDNATQAMILPNQASFGFVQVQFTGSNANFRQGLNGGGNRTFALNGNGMVSWKSADGLELDCIVLDPDADAAPACPSGAPQPTVHYTILELGSEATPTDWNSAAFTNANVMTWQGYDNSNLTCTVKMLWDNTTTDRLYISTNCNDTDDEIANTSNDAAFTSAEDNVDFRWRSPPDTVQTFDSSMRRVIANLQPVYGDADYSGVGGTANLATNFNTTVAKTVVAATSWQSFIAIDAGSVTADTTGLCNLAIRDRDAGTSTTIKHFYGTNISGMTDATQYGNCKFSSTTVPASGGGGDVTAPTVSNTAETNLTTNSATITFDTNEAGTAFVVYGTGTGDYTLTSSTSPCTSSCVITLTGLASGTTYYYRAKVTDAAANTGQSAEDTAATTSASTATLFVSAAGSGNCLTIGTPCSFSSAFALAVPGSIIEAAAGTYQGSGRMIAPTSGITGTAANPITVRCATDGACNIDGQDARAPITLTNNDWFIIEGFNAYNSNLHVVNLGSSADNNIVRRVVAYHANVAQNYMVFNSNNNTGNVFEDVAGFGTGRKIFQAYNSSGTIFRRAWGMWENDTSVGPKSTFNLGYAGANNLCENCIGTWNGTAANQPTSIFRTGPTYNNSGENPASNGRYFGSIAYLTNSQTSNLTNIVYFSEPTTGGYQDVVVYLSSNHAAKRPFQLTTGEFGACTDCYMIRTTEVGGVASSIGTGFTQTNRIDVATLGSTDIWDGASQANVCFRYQNGTLTGTKLWPWPMDERIGALWDAHNGAGSALATFGSLTAPITTQMETIFGVIPASCKA